MQVPATASVVPQVVVLLKALALVPPMEIAPKVTGTVPLLVSVTDCAVLVAPATISGKVSEVVLRLMVGTTAVPLNATVTGLVLELLAMFKDALKLPAVVAAKFTVVVQLAEIASVALQVVDSLKLLALVPEIVMPLIVSAVPPLLVSFTVCAVAVAPATMLGNVNVV